MILKAVPAETAATVKTAFSREWHERDTMVCRAVMTWRRRRARRMQPARR